MIEYLKVITILVLIPGNLYIFNLIRKAMFSDWGDFWECVKHDFTPDLYSLFKGRLLKDWEGEFRLKNFIFVCVVIIFVEILVYNAIFY